MDLPQLMAPILAQLAVSSGDKTSSAHRSQSAIIEAIKAGILSPGTRLIEAELCNALGVSRTPLREALTALRADGIVCQVGQSLQVRRLAWRDIQELYDMRAVLESAAASFAARSASASEKQVIAELVKREKQLIAEAASPDVLARHNFAFHRAIGHAAHNPFLIEALDRLAHLFVLIGDTAYSLADRVTVIAAQHAAINEAIQKGDETAAHQAMARHLQDALTARLRLFHNHGTQTQ